LNERSTIRLSQRLITAAVLIALSGILAACADQLGNFDPTDMLDWMDSKKKLAGDRKPVFPDGVPGLEQGVPKQLYKGAGEQQQNAEAAAAAAPPPAEEPKSKGKKSKAKQQAAAPAAEADAPGEADGAAAAVPADPKPKKIVRKRTTAPPPDQPAAQPGQAAPSAQPAQQSAAPFPAPLPGASATR
jgi:hypothetical protein